jgi:membrane-bound ClpP family serine protease
MTAGLVGRLAGPLAVVAASGVVTAQSDVSTSPPVVYSAEVDSIIHPVSADYMIETMDRADRAAATLVVFTLRTPGGLVDSTRNRRP